MIDLAVDRCLHCGQEDDHPKVILGRVGPTPLLENGTVDFSRLIAGHHYGVWHHDCTPAALKRTIISSEANSQHPLIAAKVFAECERGLKGEELRQFIGAQAMRDLGDATMATTGIDQTMANAILTALSPISGTATIGTVTVTFPIKCRFDSAMTTTDSGASTEWSTASGYTAGGVSLGANWAAASAGARASSTAVTVTNAPAQTWAGNELWDSSGTPLRTFWGALSGGNKTVNLGDTCTIGSGSLIQQLT